MSFGGRRVDTFLDGNIAKNFFLFLFMNEHRRKSEQQINFNVISV